MRFLLLSLLSTLIFNATWAQDENCLAPEDVARIQSKFKISVERNNNDFCDTNNYNYKMVEALLFLEGLDLSGPQVSKPWNQDILTDNWLNFLRSRSRVIIGGSQDPINPQKCHSNEYVFAYVYPYPEARNIVFVCSQGIKDQSVADLTSTLLHEVRHHEGFGHVTCKSGFFKGKPGCDHSIQAKGSYSVTIEAYSKLAVTAKNIHPILKQSSLYKAISYTDRFNETFINVSSYSVLQDFSGKSFIFDGKELKEESQQLLPEGDVFIRTGDSFIVFPKNRNIEPLAVEGGFNSERLYQTKLQGSFVLEYQGQTPKKRASYKDAIYRYSTDNRFSVFLVGNTVRLTDYDDGSEPIDSFIEGPWSEAVRLFIPQDYNASVKNRVYVLDSRDDIYRIEFKSGKHSVQKIENPYPGIKAIVNFGKDKYGLDQDGRLVKRIGKRFEVIEKFKDLRFQSLSRAAAQEKNIAELMEKYSQSIAD